MITRDQLKVNTLLGGTFKGARVFLRITSVPESNLPLTEIAAKIDNKIEYIQIEDWHEIVDPSRDLPIPDWPLIGWRDD